MSRQRRRESSSIIKCRNEKVEQNWNERSEKRVKNLTRLHSLLFFLSAVCWEKKSMTKKTNETSESTQSRSRAKENMKNFLIKALNRVLRYTFFRFSLNSLSHIRPNRARQMWFVPFLFSTSSRAHSFSLNAIWKVSSHRCHWAHSNKLYSSSDGISKKEGGWSWLQASACYLMETQEEEAEILRFSFSSSLP